MKSPHRNLNHSGFLMLSGEAQKQRTKFEYVVIFLMLLLTVSSITWSLTIHILSGDLYNGLIGAKLAFRERNFEEMSEHSKQLFYKDLEILINNTYANTALNDATNINEPNSLPHLQEQSSNIDEKPKRRKISHLFQISSDFYAESQTERNTNIITTTTEIPQIKFNATADQKFLSSMAVDVLQTRWSANAAIQYFYNFPFFSEVIAIIWTAMCLVFQSGVKKYWALPKPWRIVVPSIIMFSIMSTCTIIYVVLANKFLKTFCYDLRMNLTNPNAISCGQAISVLRPIIRDHEFSHDFYLILFRISHIITLSLWLLALLIMVLRYALAIDFQLVETHGTVDKQKQEQQQQPQQQQQTMKSSKQSSPYTQVLLSPSQFQPNIAQIAKYSKSDDDFQSAKSQLSEVATPLLETQQPHKIV